MRCDDVIVLRVCRVVVFRERLGSKADDMAAIKTHQWFAGFDWGGVQAGEYFNQVIWLVIRRVASLLERFVRLVDEEPDLIQGFVLFGLVFRKRELL